MQTADVFEMQRSNADLQIHIWSYVGRKMYHQAAKLWDDVMSPLL